MASHFISLTDHPGAAQHLAALFAACSKPSGKSVYAKPTPKTRPVRDKLAKMLGPGDVSEVLANGEPILVRPASANSWEIATESDADGSDRRLIEIFKAEMIAQGLNANSLAKRAGMAGQTVWSILEGNGGLRWANVRKILNGLGKSLTWLAEKMEG